MQSEFIKEFREEALKLTQEEFAQEVGASTSTVGNWEKGYVITPKWLPALAKLARKNGQDQYAAAFEKAIGAGKPAKRAGMDAKLDEILDLVRQLVEQPKRPLGKR